MRPRCQRWVILGVLVLTWGPSAPRAAVAMSLTRLQFLGEARLPPRTRLGDTEVGGLSGLTFDPRRGVFYVVSDDSGGRGPARFYTVRLDLEAAGAVTGVEVIGVTTLRDDRGEPLPRGSVDGEGIALLGDSSLFVSSEGHANRLVPPFVRRFDLDGRLAEELALPQGYLPRSDRRAGVRHNLGFESLTLTPDGRHLFTASENALLQDGPEAALGQRSPCRILRFDLASGRASGEFLYWTEPLAAAALVPDGLEVAGLVELLALHPDYLLALERSFSLGVGNSIRLFEVSLAEATNFLGLESLAYPSPEALHAADKRLVLDLGELGVQLDNLEGMTFGPGLPDGRRTLVLVGDDNFNPPLQVTQFLVLGVDHRPVDIDAIQGAAHRSPLEGEWIRRVRGVVTAVEPLEPRRFWMEGVADDGVPATSNGLLLERREGEEAPAPGSELLVGGRVSEVAAPGELSTTTLQIDSLETVSTAVELPAAVRLGPEGRRPPSAVIDDDGLLQFDPAFDGIDFWESLESMRVAIKGAVVVGPTDRFGEAVVAVGAAADGRTPGGGLLLRPGDENPERLTVDVGWLSERRSVSVGDRFLGDLTGIVDYRFGRYRLRATAPLPATASPGWRPEITELASAPGRLTVATFNVDNLSDTSAPARFQGIAETVAVALGGPDLVALQEVQDDSGPTDDGTLGARRTLERLTGAIAARGGPRYSYRQIDPEDRRDGGQPGGNIRVVLLFNPDRVSFVDRGAAGAVAGVAVEGFGREARLTASPGRIAPLAAAFEGDPRRGFEPSRKPLAAELVFEGHRLFVVNVHFSSKRSDGELFGALQPPPRRSEDQRAQQATLVADFVAQLLSHDPRAGIVVLGDFNEHEFGAALRILSEAGLHNLIDRLPVADRYGFNHRGNSQALDHVLVSSALLELARARVDIVHRNADLAVDRRTSDHDPVIVELDFSRRR